MLLVDIPWAHRVWALPFFTVLAPSQRHHQSRRHRHKNLTDWSRQMLTQVRRWLPHRAIVLVADSNFAALELLEALRQLSTPVRVVTRLRWMLPFITLLLSAKRNKWVVHAQVGKRLPTLKALIDNPYTPWHTVVVKDWYGHGDYTLQITSHTAVWYHTGLPAVPIRWVLLKDPKGQFQPQALLCTDTSAQPIQILHWFRQRWQLEVTFLGSSSALRG